jgi:hypothetical protein
VLQTLHLDLSLIVKQAPFVFSHPMLSGEEKDAKDEVRFADAERSDGIGHGLPHEHG